MLNFKQSLALAALGLLAGACGGARGGALTGLPPGMTAIEVANHVDSADELDKVAVLVDGQPVPLASVPPRDGDPAVVARLRLEPGAHTIGIRTVTRTHQGERVIVGAQRGFHVSERPAAITVDVRSRTVAPTDGGETVAVELAMAGGALEPAFGEGPSEDKDKRCGPLLPMARAVCRASVDLEEANRTNDVVGALCLKDKITAMRRLALASESGRGDAPEMALREVTKLSLQVDRCIAARVIAPQPDGITVIPPTARR